MIIHQFFLKLYRYITLELHSANIIFVIWLTGKEISIKSSVETTHRDDYFRFNLMHFYLRNPLWTLDQFFSSHTSCFKLNAHTSAHRRTHTRSLSISSDRRLQGRFDSWSLINIWNRYDRSALAKCSTRDDSKTF